MHLLDLFESTNEGYTVTRGIDRERYQERAGLEGPFQTKSGKVVYYDKKEGKYYDPDSDMYIDHDDYAALDEGVGTYLKGAVLAGLLGLGVNQMADMTSAKNSPLGQAMAQAAEQGDQYAAKHLNKLDAYFDLNDTGSIKILSQKYLNKTIESVYEEVATNKRTERILKLLRAKNPSAENDLEALILSFDKGQKMDREDINTLYSQNREEDREIEELERELAALKKRRGMNEDYYETDEQRELARLGRILMDMGKKRDDDVGAAMGAVGNELTKYGAPQGVNSIEKLEQVTGQSESTIMKMMSLAQKVQGDVAVGDETAGNDNEEEVKEAPMRKVPYAGYKGPGSDYRAYDEPDTKNNYEVKIDGKPWKVFRNEASAKKAAHTIEMKYGKKTTVFATTKPVSEGVAEDFDKNFSKRVGYTVKGGAASDMMKKQAAQTQQMNKDLDPGAAEKGLGIGVLDTQKAREKAAKRGIRAPGNLRASPNTRNPDRLPEAKEGDIMIGDTVQTLKMGQMQGTVTGFSKKGGIDKVMFKHESGKVYATVPENLKVIDTAKKTESQVAENIDLRHNLQPGTYKHNEENITVTINNDSSVSFKQPAQWEIEGDQEYLEFVETQLADASNWTAVVEEAKKKPVPTDPSKWSYYKSQAKKKFDVYPSAYANAWAAKQYKAAGGGWRMGKPKK